MMNINLSYELYFQIFSIEVGDGDGVYVLGRDKGVIGGYGNVKIQKYTYWCNVNHHFIQHLKIDFQYTKMFSFVPCYFHEVFSILFNGIKYLFHECIRNISK